MTVMGDTVQISGTKEGVKFSVAGDIGSGMVMCRPSEEKDEDQVSVKLEEEVARTSIIFS